MSYIMHKSMQSIQKSFIATVVILSILGLTFAYSHAVSAASKCGGVNTSVVTCKQDNSTAKTEDNGIWGLLLIIVNVLTAGVAVVGVAGIVYGAVLYTTASDKSDQVKKATDIITNVVIGLVMFAMMWAVLNYLIPGGVFG